jgi:hypothetical protein
MVVDLLVAYAHKQENVSPTNDRLIRVIRVHVETASNENPGEDITGCGNSLTCLSSDSKSKVKFSRVQRLFPSGLFPT